MKPIRAALVVVLLAVLLAAIPVQETLQAAGSVNHTFYCDALVVDGTTDHDYIIADVIVRWSSFPGTSRAKQIIEVPGTGLRSFRMIVPISPALTNPAPATAIPPYDADNKEQFLYIAGFDAGQDPYFEGESYLITDAICSGVLSVAGCDLQFIPETAVGGTFVTDTPVYFAPGQAVEPPTVIAAGNTAWVLGVDATGQYYKFLWSCDQLWAPVASMGPNYDAVWNGTPLPTVVVE